ncbi:MAG: hypothetical protein CM15mP74_21230 [Halieaceae bacterium]|nr:MAG: hypothetical protein CM15mP74_21230 [Halieaceae bacterium]
MLAGYNDSAELYIRLIVRKENDGYGAGHNVAMAGLQGKLHLILNPDVELAGGRNLTCSGDYVE